MIKKLSILIVNLQISKGNIEEAEKKIYLYAYQLMLSRIASIFLMFVISACLGTVKEIFLFMLAFVILRQYAGGFHFNNAEICIFFSTVVCMLVTIGLKSNIGGISTFAAVIIEIIVFVMIWKLAPIDSKNKRLDNFEKRAYKNRSRIVLIIECLILLLSIKESWSILWMSILIAHIVVATSLVIAYVLNIFWYQG